MIFQLYNQNREAKFLSLLYNHYLQLIGKFGVTKSQRVIPTHTINHTQHRVSTPKFVKLRNEGTQDFKN